MPTVTTRYVNTASSGGDGTTNNTSGATAAYASLSAALSDIASDFPDFVSSDVQVDVLCTGSTIDSTSFTVPSITTDATRFLRIKAQATDKASLAGWDTNKYRFSTTVATTLTFNTSLRHVRLEDLQIENRNTANSSCSIITLNTSTAAAEIVISNCRIRKGGSFVTTGHRGVVFAGGFTGSNYVVVNCLVEGLTTSGCVGILGQIGGNICKVFNTLVVGAPTGFNSTAGSNHPRLANCRAASCTDGYNGTWHANSTNNASDIASDAPGSNPQDSISNNFTDAGSGDYTYASGDGAIDVGADLSGDTSWSFAEDMEGTSRPQNSVWDIGPFEFVSGGGGGGGIAVISSGYHLRGMNR